MDKIAIFSGNANRALAQAVCQELDGGTLAQARVTAFSDGETWVEVQENVRGVDCYIIQPTCAPTDHHVMELLIMVDALRRASAGSITAVLPYYGYGRQDRKTAGRTPITSKLVANLIMTAGVDRVVSMDLHAAQIQGFFDVPHDHLFAKPALLEYLRGAYANAVVVSPDAGGVERARAYSKAIPRTTLAIVDKRRERPNESDVMHIIGDVAGQMCLVVDDMIDTAGTLVKAAHALMGAGAIGVAACATHPVLSGQALATIADSPLVEVVVTDTIPLSEAARALGKFRVVSIARLLAEAIRRIHHKDSVSSLFS